MPRRVKLLIAIICFGLFYQANLLNACQDEIEWLREELLKLSEAELDEALAKMDQTRAPRIAGDLAALLSRRSSTVQWRILRVLEMATTTEMQAESEVVTAVKPFLDHADVSFRAIAVDIMVNIGVAAIPTLEKGLLSESGRTRSGCVAALNRIGHLTEQKNLELSQDPDARVRYQAALALGRTEASMHMLVKSASDAESSVAWLAIDRLGRYPEFHSVIVPALIDLLGRKEVAVQAAISLGRFGTDSAAAIPALIRSSPLGEHELYRFPSEIADHILARLGPPRLEDLDQLISLLGSEDLHQRTLASLTIGKIGLSGKKASTGLLDLINSELHRLQKHSAERDDLPDSFHPDRVIDYRESISAALIAYWNVTEDSEAIEQLLSREEIATCVQLPEELSVDAPTESQIRFLRACVNSPCKSLRDDALGTIQAAQYSFVPIHHDVRLLRERDGVLADDTDYWNAYARTVPLGTIGWEEQLCELYRTKRLTLQVFAETCKTHDFRRQETLQLLKNTFLADTSYQANRAFEVFLSFQDDPVKELVELHSEHHLKLSWILPWLQRNSIYSQDVFRIVCAGLQSDSEPERAESLMLIPRFKDLLNDKSTIVNQLREEFEHRISKYSENDGIPSEFEETLAVAIHQMSGDPECVKRIIALQETYFATFHETEAYANGTVANMLRQCETWDERFDAYLITGLESQHPHFAIRLPNEMIGLQDWLEVAYKSKNPRVKELVANLENSKDVVVSKATSRAKKNLEGDNR